MILLGLAIGILVAYWAYLKLSRPEPTASNEMSTCPQCHGPVEEDFLLCPRCQQELRRSCAYCGEQLEADWTLCPFCGQSAAASAGRPARLKPQA